MFARPEAGDSALEGAVGGVANVADAVDVVQHGGEVSPRVFRSDQCREGCGTHCRRRRCDDAAPIFAHKEHQQHDGRGEFDGGGDADQPALGDAPLAGQ